MKHIIGAAAALVVMTTAARAEEATAVEAILQADRDFAAMAAEAGPEAAFAVYMDGTDGRLIRGTPDAVTGEADIRASFAQWPDGMLLHWEPLEGFAAEGGDFGVTWGLWSIHADGDRDSAPASRGTYITVWRQDEAGNWRGLLDMGTNDPSYRPDPPEADSQSAPEDD